MVFAVEREEVMLYVEVKDPSAPVYFYINGKKVDEGEFRFEHTSSGGKLSLTGEWSLWFTTLADGSASRIWGLLVLSPAA